MQKTVYYCDQCKRIIGVKKQISLHVSQRLSGIATPPAENFNPQWVVKELTRNFLHFCKGECIGKYFDKLIAEK